MQVQNAPIRPWFLEQLLEDINFDLTQGESSLKISFSMPWPLTIQCKIITNKFALKKYDSNDLF